MATPVRRQYLTLKARHPDAILFFRLGDFYETFDDDAKLVASELDIALTSKPMGGGLRSPLAGVPVRSVEQHLARLVERGHRVAICEQLEQPSAARGLVRRGVVRVVSPGTALEPALLEAGQASACAAVWLRRGRRGLRLGLAAAEVTTGRCQLSELRGALDDERALWRRAADQLERLGARELVVADDTPPPALDPPLELTVTPRPASEFGAQRAARAVAAQYAAPPEAFRIEPDSAALGALGALLEYLRSALPSVEEGCPPAREREAAVGLFAGHQAVAEAGAALERGPGPGAAVGGGAAAGVDGALRQLEPPRWIDSERLLQWDQETQRALGLVDAGPQAASDAVPRTLLAVIDRCGSALGRRWLRSAVSAPLLELERIERRLDRVESLVGRPGLRRALAERLRGWPDLERLLARAAAGLARPPELASLARGLVEAADLAAAIESAELGAAEASAELRADGESIELGADVASAGLGADDASAGPRASADRAALGDGLDQGSALAALAGELRATPEAARALAEALEERPAAEYGSGVVRSGVDAEIDRRRAQAAAAREALSAFESELRRETGIEQLRIGYHRTFGYQIELSRAQAARAPESWQRRQSLRDRERFTEPRLRELERALEAAEEDWAEAERALVERLRLALVDGASRVRRIAGAVARLDAAASLASVAAERAWTRPELDHSGELEIAGGRHPIVEAAAPQGAFVANDLSLADDGRRAPQLLLVTGPNMAGKSTYLRQAALIVILAQMGSFTPAERTRVGLVDRIFARVGAHDDLARGRSTFMVEMLETARLLHGASDRSLVLLDEVGRGTSTWDGLAIARAVAESLSGCLPVCDLPASQASAGAGGGAGEAADGIGGSGAGAGCAQRGPRTLFATHFHELTELAGVSDRVANAAVQVAESDGGEVEFLYRVAPGAADRSYGVQVASQAGLPRAVIARAETLLAELESQPLAAANRGSAMAALSEASATAASAAATPLDAPLLEDLARLDVDGMTPLEAISALYALRDDARRAVGEPAAAYAAAQDAEAV